MKDNNIGFIGLGIMGESMCENLIKAGYNLTVYDIDPTKIEKMLNKGAVKAESVIEAANKSSYIIIMVPNTDNVKNIIEKLLSDESALREKIIIDMSTISPTVSKELADKVKKAGGVMIDAPVVKSKAAAVSGDLGILVGGDKDILEEVKPMLKYMGKNIIHMGPNGNGLVMKLCHNTLVAEIQNGVNEMLTLAQESGIDTDSFIKAISSGGGQNFYLDAKGQSIKERDFTPKFPFEHMHKDLVLTNQLIKELNMDLPGILPTLNVYIKGMEENLNREDFSASFKVVEKESKKKK